MILVLGAWAFVRALLGNSASVSMENVALRHQLAILQRSGPRPRPGQARVGSALTAVGGLAVQPLHRSACDSPRLAPQGLPALLALESPGAAQWVARHSILRSA